MSSNVNELFHYPVQYFEVRPEFGHLSDNDYATKALVAARFKYFGQAGAFVREIRDRNLRDKTATKILSLLVTLQSINRNEAYYDMHQFIENWGT